MFYIIIIQYTFPDQLCPCSRNITIEIKDFTLKLPTLFFSKNLTITIMVFKRYMLCLKILNSAKEYYFNILFDTKGICFFTSCWLDPIITVKKSNPLPV